MALSKKEESRVSARVFTCLSTITAVVLLVVGVVCWMSGASIISQVNKSLVDEKIYFPPEGNPAFSAAAFPEAQKYAGQQVTTGAQAKAYAEDFLAVQLKLAGGGKTLSEVSAAAQAAPQNVALQGLQQAMFQGTTSKSLLLGNGYSAWMQGVLVRNIGMGAVVLAAGLALLAAAQMMRYKRQ